MDAVAAALGSALAGLPSAGRFVGSTFLLLAVLAGAFFLLRHTRFVSGLAAGLDRALTGVVATVLLAMVFLSGLQILLRNVFSSGLAWIDPLLRHLVLLLAFVGAILATGAKRHVQINVLGRLLHGVAARVAGTVVAAIAAIVLLLLTHASLELLRDEVEFGEIAFLSLPTWVVVGIFPTAFLVMAFRFLHLAFQEAAGVAPAAPEEEIGSEEAQGT